MQRSFRQKREKTQGVTINSNMDSDQRKQRNGQSMQDSRRETKTPKYWQLNKAVKKSARKDKQNYINDPATQAEMAAHRRDMKKLYGITRKLAGKRRNPSKPVKDKEGRTINKEVEQRSRWEEHFKEILNSTNSRKVNTNPPSKAEISRALKMLKDGKTPGPDGIPPEALKDTRTRTAYHQRF